MESVSESANGEQHGMEPGQDAAWARVTDDPQSRCVLVHRLKIMQPVVGRGNNAEAATATASQCPEQIDVGAGVSSDNPTICEDNLEGYHVVHTITVVTRG